MEHLDSCLLVLPQGIFENYKQPFAVTYLGASLMVIYLPLAFLKDWMCSLIRKRSGKSGKNIGMIDNSCAGVDSPLKYNGGQKVFEMDSKGSLNRKHSEVDLSAQEEGKPLVSRSTDGAESAKQEKEVSTREIAMFGFYLAPIWFITEVIIKLLYIYKFLSLAELLLSYRPLILQRSTFVSFSFLVDFPYLQWVKDSFFPLTQFSKIYFKKLKMLITFVSLCYFLLSLLQYLSNAALARTSVASTTVLSSTSGLFTLFIGAFLGQDSLSVSKVVAVFISMAGVAMATLGKTWAADEAQLNPSLYVFPELY